MNHESHLLLWSAIILVLFFFALPFLGAQTGPMVWETLRVPSLAIFLSHDAEFALYLGNHYFNVRGDGAYDLARAEKYFNKALILDPMVPDAWHQLSRIDFLRSDFRGATKKINKQLELHGDSFMASYYIRGLISGYAKNYSQAEEDMKKFLTWDDKNWAAHNDLAWVYFKQGKFEEVREIASRGLEYNPGNPWLLTSLGAAQMNLGEKEAAKSLFEEALVVANLLTLKDWEKAYPGNNPEVAEVGLESMRSAIISNLSLLQEKE